ncbi:Edem3, partial [Symbiodinium sp. KB8]
MSGPVWGHRRFLYFEVGVTHAERGTEAPAPQVMAGLWVNTPGGVGAGDTGCTWGPGCIAYSGSDGRLARWRAVVPDSLLTPTAEAGPSVTHTTSPCLGPAAAPGAPTTDSTPSALPEQTAPPTTVGGIAFEVGAMVDVKDLHSEPTWRPGIIQAVQGDDVKVHYLGWDASWDETLPRSSERLAPPGSHSRGATPTGYMQRLPYGSVWGQRGDTVGVLLDRATATLAFTLNGVYQGVAARGVRGRFHPAFSTTNPSATLCLNTGGLPFVWPDAPPPLGEQPTPSAHAEALAALPQPEPEDEAFEAAEAAAHAVLLASAEEAEAQAQAAAQAARSRPVAYPHAERRNTAMELKEMMPPELRVELVMRVLASAHDSREQAAEFLLMRGGSMLGATAQADALADEEAQRYKNCTFLEASYTNSARTSHLLPHTLSGFGGVPPPAPGMALPVVAAEPLQADEPLVNAEEVAGKWALVHRGACTFVTKMRHAQAAGAAGVLLVNSEGSEPFIANAGTENVANLTIPMLLVSHAKGTALQADAEGDSGLVVTARVGLRPPPPGATSSVRAEPVADTGAAAPGSAVDSPSGTAESASPPPSKAAPLALEECIHHTGYGCGPEGPLVLGSVASREAADACLGREPGQVGPHWTPSADAVVHPQAPVGALSRYAASLLDADAVLAGQGAGVPAADGGTAGLQVGDAGTAAGPGRAGAASEQSAVDAWVATVQNQMARRRVPGGMVTMVTGMLREGGENQMAMARSMLADIGITLPPRPETETAQAAGAGRSPRLGPSPLAGPALLPSLSRIPSVDSPVMSPRMTPQLAGRTSSQGAEAPELTRGQSHDASGGDGLAGGLDSVVYGRTSSANPSAGLDISKAFPGQAV